MRVSLIVALLAVGACQKGADDPDGASELPLDPNSPWPKFRANARQDARGTPRAEDGNGQPWVVPTGKGIFASPVVDGDGTVYVGSADRSFYAIGDDGAVRWTVETGEIIDSAGLLDDAGHVFFASGDGHLYARNRADGTEAWTFEAEDPATIGSFINWFEGNVGMLPNGDLIAPNDNFRIYGINRETGEKKWGFAMGDQTWALPAVDPATSRLYASNNNLIDARGGNLYAIDGDGAEVWRRFSGLGTIAASPLLTRDGHLVVGSFDGFVRAYDASNGEELWSFGTRDHLYSSPAALGDGTLIQPSADGTVYAIDPADGSLVWAFDTQAPIRSSPAVGGDDRIYIGGGDGRLYVLNPDGTLRWSMQLIDGDRNDLNASPALGVHAVILAGESGEIFSVPYDWCIEGGGTDARCYVGGEDLPADSTDLYFTTRWGNLDATPPTTIGPMEPLAFSLVSRVGGDTQLALLDSDALDVTFDPPTDAEVVVSSDRRFLSILPSSWSGDSLSVTVSGTARINPARAGLAFSGGDPGPTFSHTFTFDVDRTGPNAASKVTPGARWAVRRLAAPLPTLLPSYNQIGFDSLHYEVGALASDLPALDDLAWMVGALPDGHVDPLTQVRLPLDLTTDGRAITLHNRGGMKLEAMSLTLAFDDFRIAASLDDAGSAVGGASVWVAATCGDIPFYGVFLRTLGLCNPQTDGLGVWGGVLMESESPAPEVGASPTAFALDGDTATVTFTPVGFEPATHVLSLAALDGDGAIVKADYGTTTTVTDNGAGSWTVSVPLTGAGASTLVLIVDTQPVAHGGVGM